MNKITPLYVVSFSTSQGSRVFAFHDRAAAEERYRSDYWGNRADGLATLLPGRDDDAIARALPFLADQENDATRQALDFGTDPATGRPLALDGPEVMQPPEDTFVVVRVNNDYRDTYAAKTLAEALELAGIDEELPAERVEYGTVTARDAGAARLMRPEKWYRYVKASKL